MRTSFFLIMLVPLLVAGWTHPAWSSSHIDQNNHAAELLHQGHYQEGLELLKKLHAAVPYDEQIRRNLSNGYLQAGNSYLQQKRYPELAELMLEAQEFDDTQRDFWKLRGYALFGQKAYFEAEVELQEARAMGEPDAQILYLLGEIFYTTDRMYEALDVLESAQQYDAENHAVNAMLEKVRRELAVEKEMDKEYGGHFVVTFDGEQNEELGAEVLEVLEDAYNWIGSQLDHYPEERVTVILYSQRQFSQLTNSPDWAGGLYDGKIRLPVGGIDSISDQVRGLLYHEYMHVVLRDIAGNNLPTKKKKKKKKKKEPESGELDISLYRQARENQQLFALSSLEGSFQKLSGMQVFLAYQQSYAVVRFLLDDYGWQPLRDLLFALGEGQSISQAFDAALGVYGLSYDSFEERWRESG